MRDTFIRRALNRTDVARFNYTINAPLYDLPTEALNPGPGFAFATAWDLGRRHHARIMSQLCDRSFKLLKLKIQPVSFKPVKNVFYPLKENLSYMF